MADETLERRPGLDRRAVLSLLDRGRGVLALLAVFVLGVVVSPRNERTGELVFLTRDTQSAVLYEYSEYGILAAGMTIVILTAGIDLSVGSVLGFTAMLFSLLMVAYGWGPVPAVLVSALAGAACGTLSGLFVAGIRLPTRGMLAVGGTVGVAAAGAVAASLMGRGLAVLPALGIGLVVGITAGLLAARTVSGIRVQAFVSTLAMMVAARGAAKLVSGGIKVAPGAEAWYALQSGRPPFWDWMTTAIPATGDFLRPITLLFLLVIVVMALVVRYSRFGRHLYAVGGNEEAARLSGVPVAGTKLLAYTLCGLFAGLAGACNACRMDLGNPEAGFTYELDAIAAVVIGGTSLMGCRGGVFLTLIGTLIIGYINKILSINGVEEAQRLLAKGAIIVVAVMLQERRRQ